MSRIEDPPDALDLEFDLIDLEDDPLESDKVDTRVLCERRDVEEDAIARLEKDQLYQDSSTRSSATLPPSFYYPDYALFQQEIQVTITKTIGNIHSLFQTNDIGWTQKYAPIRLLFQRKGSYYTFSHKVIQEYIDLYRTSMRLIGRLEEAKRPSNWSQFRFVWDRGWDFDRWKTDMELLCQEIRVFYAMLDYPEVSHTLDGYVSIQYSPTMSFITHIRILRPSRREEEMRVRRVPISIHRIDMDWLVRLFEITRLMLPENRKYTTYEWIRLLAIHFQTLRVHEQQDVITICEDVLGGHSLDRISANLENWLRINEDIVPLEIKKKIWIFSSLDLSRERL